MIQLINKLNGEKITDVDVNEISSLTPCLGKLITTIDEVCEINRVTLTIQQCMT